MPHLLPWLYRPIGFIKLLFPLAEILLLGQLAPAAQDIEHGGIGRRLIEEAGVELKQGPESCVVEYEFAVDVEYSDAGRKLIQYTAVCIDHARKFGAHGLGFRSIDRDARTSGCARCIDDIEDAA